MIFWSTVIEVYDAYREESFMLRAMLMWTINNFLGDGNLSRNNNEGDNACLVYGDVFLEVILFLDYRKSLTKR